MRAAVRGGALALDALWAVSHGGPTAPPSLDPADRETGELARVPGAWVRVAAGTGVATITLPVPGVARWFAAALGAGPAALSRREFFLRTGLSAPQVADVAAELEGAADGRPFPADLPLELGVEAAENPAAPAAAHPLPRGALRRRRQPAPDRRERGSTATGRKRTSEQ